MSAKTYGGFVRDYDPRKPNMHSIFRAEDDTRTMSPEMDAWRSRQIAKRCVCGKPAERHTEDGVGLCKACFAEIPTLPNKADNPPGPKAE